MEMEKFQFINIIQKQELYLMKKKKVKLDTLRKTINLTLTLYVNYSVKSRTVQNL